MEVLDRMPWVAKDSIFHRLVEIAEVSNMTKEERIKYDSALRHYRDTINIMRGAEDKGVARGMARWRAEGIYETNFKNAKSVKALGLSADMIQKITGLSIDEIDKL